MSEREEMDAQSDDDSAVDVDDELINNKLTEIVSEEDSGGSNTIGDNDVDDSCSLVIIADDPISNEELYNFLVRITLPIDIMPGIEAKRYIDAMITSGGGRVESIVRCSHVPSPDYEIQMKEFIVYVQISIPINSTCLIRSQKVSLFINKFTSSSSYGLDTQLHIEFPKLNTIFTGIRTEDNYIMVNNFALGNCPNRGIFFVRGNYISKYNTKNSNINMVNQNSQIIEKPGGNHDNISWANFEHDEKKIIIRFAVPLSEPEDDGLCFHGFRFIISYSSIVSITVNTKDQYQADLYLKLKYPPLLYQLQPPSVNDMRTINLSTLSRHYNNWYRVLQFPGSGSSHGCSRQALCENGVFHIGVNTKITNKSALYRIHSIVSRIQSRSPTIKIYFGFVASHRRSIPKIGHLPSLGSYRADYALQAIISRGTVVTDELFDVRESTTGTNTRNFFIQRLLWCMKECSAACEEALELVLTVLDERRNITIEGAFDRLYASRVDIYRRCATSHKAVEAIRTIPLNCVLVRKVTVTPSCIIPMAPDVMMTNRVVRKFGADHALRVVYRDDNGLKLRVTDFGSDHDEMSPLVIHMIKNTMGQKISICGRDYYFLAWSNSQMRDHGCYMYSNVTLPDGTQYTIDSIRDWMGDFSSSKNVPKLMSRMGQCFTQAQPTVTLQSHEWIMEPDIVGGTGHPETGELYTFSDGVGRMSLKLARELAEILELKIVPSCYQVRFLGFKGVLTIDRSLDAPEQPKVIFRKSQHKFSGIESKRSVLEVVKYAMPSPMCLNRPLITILDYVSEKQGKIIHDKMTSRVHYYLEKELNTLSQMLLNDKEAAIVLSSRLPISIDFNRLLNCGFSLTDEPFFHQMLVSIYRYSVSQHLAKAKLEMPSEMGRSMFGVLDETGLLQYGQVFIQYSPGIRSASDKPLVHLGPVLVSKNPCHAPGDTRVLEAVWISSLSHLSDVIVFPRYGPRPHPDEMAGSDLDGDEYSVIFDRDMLFQYNEPPMIFPKTVAADFDNTPTTNDMAEFFLKYLKSDSVGRVSNAHLHMADKKGLFSRSCHSLARKCSIAVDFPKSGEPADPLERDERLIDGLPDFAENKSRPSYRSERLNGRLYRRVKKIEEVIELCERSQSIFENNYDTVLYRSNYGQGRETEWRETTRLCDEYTSEMQQLMDEYGIASEAAIVSGKLVNPKRLAAMEKDDYSFYNTDKIVELRYHKIWSKYREKFFKEFGDEEELYEMDNEGNQVLRTDNVMREKARMWYIIAYIEDGESSDEIRVTKRPCKSFAWIVWDVLADLKRKEMMSHRCMSTVVKNVSPISKLLSEEIGRHLNDKSIEFHDFCIRAKNEDEIIERYSSTYGQELLSILFILDGWLKKEGLYDRSPIRLSHLSRLLIQFSLGHIHVSGSVILPLQMSFILPKKLPYTPTPSIPLGDFTNTITEPGHVILSFLSYIGSYGFFSVSSIDLSLHDDSPYPTPLLSRPIFWRPLSQVAYKTIHHISLSGRFSSLAISDDDTNELWGESHDPIVVSDLFDMGRNRVNIDLIISTLKRWTGVHTILIRQSPQRSREFFVTIAGPAAARMKLSRLFQMDNSILLDAIKEDKIPSIIYDETI